MPEPLTPLETAALIAILLIWAFLFINDDNDGDPA